MTIVIPTLVLYLFVIPLFMFLILCAAIGVVFLLNFTGDIRKMK